ncbi:GerA spore germination protein [Paenibacillus taihuensis]|uniref:GerA spore germination protein n=1 Tax=Paenibacillus taihuensis TaxID=1156355 RepID=A0A3D9S7K8_9BACL|nr:spore germination protein [Paenibacillus taihuensis]REE89014.1 GerA spore germination protein [Paenibacillus taihuensis]
MFTLDAVKVHFSTNPDFVLSRIHIGDEVISVTGLKSLINFPQSVHLLREPLLALEPFTVQKLVEMGQELPASSDRIIDEILNGMLIAVHDATDVCISIIPVPQSLSRSISNPLTENNVRGSSSAFNEDIDTNLGLLRKHVNSSELQINHYSCGSMTKNTVTLCFLNQSIDPNLLHSITQLLESGANSDLSTLKDLSKLFKFPLLTLVSSYLVSELPQTASRALKDGKVVIFIERLPFAIILPSLISDMFMTEDDLNHPMIYSVLLRSLRVIGALMTLMAPGLYVAIVSVNPDVLRFELAHTIAISRLDVPYPAIIEALLLLLILELIMEAIIRLPSSIGPTVTMVGGIVLGEAVVQAKLVSSLLIIVLAAVTIANATVVGFQNSYLIRLLKYLLLFLSALFGVTGLLAGIVIICAYLSSLTTLGVPYLQLKQPKGE